MHANNKCPKGSFQRRSLPFLLPVAFTAFLAMGADRVVAQITSVSPQSGPVTGGTQVTIEGSELISSQQVGTPGPTGPVYFGSAVASNEAVSSSTKRVVTSPPHPPGLVDLTAHVWRTKNAFRYVIFGDPLYTRYLVPTFINEPEGLAGAVGSRWKTFLTAYNGEFISDVRIVQSPNPACTFPGCREGALEAGEQTAISTLMTNPRLGAFLHIESFPDASNLQKKFPTDHPAVHFVLRVQDVSRQSQTYGTEVPVVRDSDAFGSGLPIILTDIPTGDAYRRKIRVYDFFGLNGQKVQVEVFGRQKEGPDLSLLGQKELTLEGGTFDGRGYPLTPAAAEFDVTAAEFPGLSSFERATIKVGSFALFKFWAYATIVNNETQHVTLITPR